MTDTQKILSVECMDEMTVISVCNIILKDCVFSGFYAEKRYLPIVDDNRDMVGLIETETSFEKKLLEVRSMLHKFYEAQNRQVWIGIAQGIVPCVTPIKLNLLDTYIWVKVKAKDLKFGPYTFIVKRLHVRDNEIVLKVKVEEKPVAGSLNTISLANNVKRNKSSSTRIRPEHSPPAHQVNLHDFKILLQQWWTSIKQTAYEFMAEDISKQNIKDFLRFMGLLLFSIVSAAIVAVKYFGIFIIRFIFELSRLTHALTPIFLKLIEVLNKIIGGFYILLAMVWKDTVVNRNQAKYNALPYNRPLYNSLQYDVKQRTHRSPISPSLSESMQ